MGHCCPGILASHNGRGPRQLVIRACLVIALQHGPRRTHLGNRVTHLGNRVTAPAGPSWPAGKTAQLATGHGPAGHGLMAR